MLKTVFFKNEPGQPVLIKKSNASLFLFSTSRAEVDQIMNYDDEDDDDRRKERGAVSSDMETITHAQISGNACPRRSSHSLSPLSDSSS